MITMRSTLNIHYSLSLRVTVALGAMCALLACQKDEPVSAIDPYPYPSSFTSCKDMSIKPGDSFFDYCNGAWLSSHPIPSDPAKVLGGMYDAEGTMDERVEQLKAEVPDLNRVFYLMDNIHSTPEQVRSFIAEQKAKTTKPQSLEDAYRAIGKMYLEGANVLEISVAPLWDAGVFKCVIIPPLPTFTPPASTSAQYFPLLQTKGGETSMLGAIAEGMGIDPSMVFVEESVKAMWDMIQDQYTLDDLYKKMVDAWDFYEVYADEAGLEAYNATKSTYTRKTLKSLKEDARTDLSYMLSYHLQQKFIPQSLKDKYLGITKEVQTALRGRIQAVDWLSETTKQNALDKLDHMQLNVAFPDTWHMDCIPALTDCQTMAEAAQRLSAASARLFMTIVGTDEIFTYLLTMSGKDSDGNYVPMDLTLVNAAYQPLHNSVTIYPALLLPPVMPEEGVSEACHYGVFSMIGHEFTHAFDSEGSKYDKYGKNVNWWTVADIMAFQDRQQNLVRTYSTMELDPVRAPLVFCDGERTLSENIADLGGFLTVLDAYMAKLDREGFTGETRNDQIRKFYEAFAHFWCVQYGNNKFEVLKKSDPHSHARLRVNGVVMNTDLWYELYGVTRDDKLYLPKERRAYIW